MKLTTRGKVVLASLFTSPALAIAVGLGVATPAIAPEPANALVLQEFNGAKSLSDTGLVKLLQAVGFKGKALPEAWAIAKKESQGRPLDYNGNWRTGDKSYGLFQINMIGQMGAVRRAYLGLASNNQLLNPVTNAEVAYRLSDHGKDWSDWKGVNQPIVKYYMARYPFKSKAKPHKVKAKGKPKPKQKQ
jgi:Lysozyme like domain